MYQKREIADKVFYVGVNDRQKHLFENYLSLPYGVSYNSYLIVDEKVALLDTVDLSFSDHFISQIESLLNGRPVDFLVVHHMEPDHAGSIRLLKTRYPQMKLVGNKKTFDFLKGYFNIDADLIEVAEGDSLSLGKKKLVFYMAPMVHWPEVMVSYEPESQTLFSADAFGTFGALNGSCFDDELNLDFFWDEMRRYYACIVGKFGMPVQNALKKLSALPIKTICSLHGPVWRAQLEKVVALYDRWSRYETEPGVVIPFGSMYGNTQTLAEAVAEGVVAGGLQNVVIHNVSKTDASFILADIFKYNGLIVGSPTYMGEAYPLVDALLTKIKERGVKHHVYSCFGSHSWATGAVKRMTEFAEAMKWEVVGAPVDNKFAPTEDALQKCFQLGEEVAQACLKMKE